jgi:hypothetical protein
LVFLFYAFDLFLQGKDLREEPLIARRKLLAKPLAKAPENIRLPGELRGSKDELFRVVQEFGLEGLVAKRPNSLTKAAGAAAPGSKTRSPSLRSLLSAAYVTRRKPELFWFLASRLPEPRRTRARWQSAHRFLGKSFGEPFTANSRNSNSGLVLL